MHKERLKRKILENFVRIIWELSSVNYHWELSSENYHWELSSKNYQWELSPSISSRRKVEIYRDTGVSKNGSNVSKTKILMIVILTILQYLY